MVAGDQMKRVNKYLFIDHCGEGLGFTEPRDGEEIWAVPYGFYVPDALPYIEHRANGEVTRTVNCSDIAIIVFDVKEE